MNWIEQFTGRVRVVFQTHRGLDLAHGPYLRQAWLNTSVCVNHRVPIWRKFNPIKRSKFCRLSLAIVKSKNHFSTILINLSPSSTYVPNYGLLFTSTSALVHVAPICVSIRFRSCRSVGGVSWKLIPLSGGWALSTNQRYSKTHHPFGNGSRCRKFKVTRR